MSLDVSRLHVLLSFGADQQEDLARAAPTSRSARNGRCTRVARVAEPVGAHLGDQRPSGRELLGDRLWVVGQESVAVAEVLLGDLAEHDVVEVRPYGGLAM